MIHRSLLSSFPQPFPRDPSSEFRKWVDSNQDRLSEYDQDIEAVVASHLITQADGQELDEIGAAFGTLGERRGRGDNVYRKYLQGIVDAFAGRGTKTGMTFAIAAGVSVTNDEIGVDEHFDALEYSLTLYDWERHETGLIHQLADLADPVAVELREPLNYRYETGTVEYDTDTASASMTMTLPTGVVEYGTGSSTVETVRTGHGSGIHGEEEHG